MCGVGSALGTFRCERPGGELVDGEIKDDEDDNADDNAYEDENEEEDESEEVEEDEK
jgi:hypothetical protein